MATDLTQLLEDIDPERLQRKIDGRIDTAINSFSHTGASVSTWEEFKRCLGEFYGHVERAILGGATHTSDVDFDWRRSARTLRDAYGASGDKAAFDMARTGSEGGLRAVLSTIASGLSGEFAKNVAGAHISRWWKSHSADEILSAAGEYLEEWGHLLPGDLTQGSAARLRANFLQVLEQHPRLVERFRRLGR